MLEYGCYYEGEIVAQNAGVFKEDNLKVVFDVALSGKLMDRFNPDGGCVALENPAVIQVTQFFKPDDDAGKERVEGELSKLGVDLSDFDPTMLISGEEGYISLVGKRVFVEGKQSVGGDGNPRVYWNFRFPRRFTPKIEDDQKSQLVTSLKSRWRKPADNVAPAELSSPLPF